MSKNYNVKSNCSVCLCDEEGNMFYRDYADVLESYGTPVAVYSKMQVFLLLSRYNYSATTIKHLHRFVREECYLCRDYPLHEMEKIARLGKDAEDAEYRFASLAYMLSYDEVREMVIERI